MFSRQHLKWPKPIAPWGTERTKYKGEWQIGITPRRAVSYYEGKRFFAGKYVSPPPCKHAVIDPEPDADGDRYYVVPSALFAGYLWADNTRQVTWLCVDCIKEHIKAADSPQTRSANECQT